MLYDIFIYSALIGGLVLIGQLAMSFLGVDDLFEGADADGGLDVDFDSDGADASGFWLFEMLSIRTLTAALAFFGLGGWAMKSAGASDTMALIVALAAGYAALYSVYWMFKQIFKLETDGNLDIRNAVGRPAKVYIPIPAERAGTGKVQMKLQDRLVEFPAVTEDTVQLGTGDQVTVIDLVSSNTVVVERAAEPAEA